jgi:hypothetical protein
MYFDNDIEATQLQKIWDWAWETWGWDNDETKRVWGWITTTAGPLGDRQIIGMKLPNKEAATVFKLMFPIPTYGEFDTIKKILYDDKFRIQ